MARLTAALDSDKDGKVSFAEFTAVQKKHFDGMDANKDGSIDEAERKQAAEKMKERFKQAREKMRGERGQKRQHSEKPKDDAKKPDAPKTPSPAQSGAVEVPSEVPPPEPA